MKRRNFLKALPAAALTLAGCGQHKTAPANTASLVFDHSYPLDYAAQFSADCYEGGYVMIDIPDAGRFLVVPEGAAEVDDLPEDVVLLRQPLDHIYLVSTSVMDLFVHLDASGQHRPLRHEGRGLVCGRGQTGHAGGPHRLRGQVQRPGL